MIFTIGSLLSKFALILVSLRFPAKNPLLWFKPLFVRNQPHSDMSCKVTFKNDKKYRNYYYICPVSIIQYFSLKKMPKILLQKIFFRFCSSSRRVHCTLQQNASSSTTVVYSWYYHQRDRENWPEVVLPYSGIYVLFWMSTRFHGDF